MQENKVARIKNTLISICLVFIIGAVCMMLIGYNPAEAYRELLKGMFAGSLNMGTTLEKFTPVILTGLAFVVSMKAGFMNRGVEGQLSLGAITAAWLGIELQGIFPGTVVTLICIVAGGLAGAAWSLIPALLRVYLNANEICTTILLNYVATLFTTYLCLYPLYGQEAVAQTAKIDNEILLSYFLKPSKANSGIVIALILLVCFALFYKKTRLGFLIKSVGDNPGFSECIGINTKKYMIIAVLFSGMLGGIAGSIEILGVYTRFINGFSNNIALYGMLAALISGGSFLALPLYSFLIAALKAGALGMERFTGLPDSLIDILIVLFILFVTMNGLFEFRTFRRKNRKEEAKE